MFGKCVINVSPETVLDECTEPVSVCVGGLKGAQCRADDALKISELHKLLHQRGTFCDISTSQITSTNIILIATWFLKIGLSFDLQ